MADYNKLAKQAEGTIKALDERHYVVTANINVKALAPSVMEDYKKDQRAFEDAIAMIALLLKALPPNGKEG